MHPLCCCISIESHESPEACLSNNAGSSIGFAGMLYKWTNYGKGWRPRWFLLRNGVLTYSKMVLQPETLANVSFIGDVSSGSSRHLKRRKSRLGIVHLKVSSFRESRSDDKRFYIFTSTKTLHLRTSSNKQRLAWIQALASSSSSTRNLLSTQGLRKRLVEEGVDEEVVKDCEQIMLLEFSQLQTQLHLLCQERLSLLHTLRQLEAANIEVEASGGPECEYPLTDLRRGKYSEWSTTESSDDVEKQELEEASEDDETYFFDTNDCFPAQSTSCESMGTELKIQPNVMADSGHLQIERRKKLPDPAEKEKGVSLWSLIKDNVGKDLTRVCLPVYFNEPISSLQKCFEDLEYSYLLDRAYQHGKEGNSLQRALNVAAFAVSGYASSEGRHCKPFNPLLGETYEADFPEKGVRFFSEKVSHHPTLIACHCEGRGWKFWGDSNIRTKFWGTSIQLDPVGILTLEFDDGEIFQWSKVTTRIYNLILSKVSCHHHGLMHIRGNREYSCKLRFKEQHFLERNPRQVHGFVEDASGKKHATIFGKWDDSMYYINGVANVKPKDMGDAHLLWQRTMPPTNLTRYNLTSFAITLNELTPGLQEKLPPTDSRLRPDQRHLENGEYDMANAEKLRLETRQRMVIVKDVVSEAVISQFRAHPSPLSALCFDPSGTLRVTASIHGNNVNIFRIMPFTRTGSSNQIHDWNSSHVLLYKLHRGITLAVIQDTSFSLYCQWISIVTSKGTSHVFVLSPFGGDAVYRAHGSHGHSVNPVRSLPWWSTPSFVVDEQPFPPSPPLTLSVVGRIKNNSSFVGKTNIPSGAVTSVFHSFGRQVEKFVEH